MFKDLNFGIASVAAPTFNDINFTKPVREVGSSFGELEKYLRNAGYAIEHETDIIVAKNGTKNFAIAVHDDRDTWVADDQTWFAAGKQKDSPVKLAMAASEKNNAIPVLYLAAKNIMDLDKWRAKWKSEGVKVIEILSEL
ncbi:hypothetical protein FACS18945_2390 [Bacteroidia bacterium]|nr:hypothetical protein FACS18945_2390 [Bacteroidia bacterium]